MTNIISEDMTRILNAPLPWETLNGTTVFISGASGFLPSYLAAALLERNRRSGSGIHVIALCRNADHAKERFQLHLKDPHLELLIQDVTEPVALSRKADYCIHAASPAGIVSRQTYPSQTLLANMLGCYQLLELCRRSKGKRFLFFSSVDVYGQVNSSRRIKESDFGCLDTMRPRNAYANGKRAGEALCAAYYAETGMETLVARPFQVYGPGMSLNDGRLHGDFVRQLSEFGKITLKSDGSARRSFLYLTDAVIALLAVLLNGKPGEAYNICDEAGEASVLELAEQYCSAFGQSASVEFNYDQRSSIEVREALPCVLGDSQKLRALGWKPETPLREGIRRTLQYYHLT